MSSSPEKDEMESCASCEFQENLELLRQTYFFSALPLETLKVLAYLCTRESFKPEEYLFQQNEDDGQAFYFISGTARLIHTDEKGEMAIRDYGIGGFIGGMSLLGSLPRLFSMRAVEPVTCLILTREKFKRVLDQFPNLMPRIFKELVEAVRNWEERFLVDRGRECDACMKKIGVTLV